MASPPIGCPWPLALAWLLCFVGLSNAQTSESDLQPLASYSEQTYLDDQGRQYRYRLCFPRGYREQDTNRYPLVLLLHGAGERGDDNQAQLRHGAADFASEKRQTQYPCFVLAPQVPREQRWVDVDWEKPGDPGTFPEQPTESMAAALAMVRHRIDAGRIDPKRVYVTGLSMGGYGTWFAVAQSPDLFAAAIPICGGGDPSWAAKYVGLPIWAFHGTDDRAVPVARTREMIDALRNASQRPEVLYTEYQGGGHDVWTETYRRDDVFAWLFDQKRP